MVCEVCNKRRASIHYLEKVNDHVQEIHLCEDCAREKGGPSKPQFQIADLLAGLADIEIPVSVKRGAPKACEGCGLTYEDFRKTGRMGCGRCYETFRESLAPLLKRIHGNSSHSGKQPPGVVGARVEGRGRGELAELRAKLDRAVQNEEYEEAARIRDRIKGLEKKPGQRKRQRRPVKGS